MYNTGVSAFSRLIALVLLGLAIQACGGGGGENGGNGNGGNDDGRDTGNNVIDLSVVSPLYPTNGVNWNDYVKNDGPSHYSATDTAADGSETGGYKAVLHGGEMRVVEVTGKNNCSGLGATDDLNIFNWECVADTNPVRMISTGLRAGKNLSDLLNFTEASWKPNRVTVTTAGVTYGQTPLTVWWTNPVIVDNDGSDGSDLTEGDIRIITANPGATYVINTKRKIALVIDPSVQITGSETLDESIISASNSIFLWIEGSLDGTGDYSGIEWSNVLFSVLRNIRVSNSRFGMYLVNVSNSILSGITASNGNYGVLLSFATNNVIEEVTVSNHSSDGIYLDNATNNKFRMLTISNASSVGLYMHRSTHNSLSDITVANSQYGVAVYSSSHNNSLNSIVAVNNGIVGIHVHTSSSNIVSNIATTDGSIGVVLTSSSNNVFLDQFLVGGNFEDCNVTGGSEPGLDDDSNPADVATDTVHDGLCVQQGASNFGLASYGNTMAGSYVGKVISDDNANTSDVNGSADFPVDTASFNWLHFDNPFRGWGKDGSDFPNADNRFMWTGGIGRIWDWSLRSTDTVALNKLAPPDGDTIVTHVWSGTPVSSDDAGCHTMIAGSTWNSTDLVCESTVLKHAVEILGNNGNDNGLCESNETCLFTPNIGSYQGHGNLISAGDFVDGVTPDALTGITLMKYETNGVPVP